MSTGGSWVVGPARSGRTPTSRRSSSCTSRASSCSTNWCRRRIRSRSSRRCSTTSTTANWPVASLPSDPIERVDDAGIVDAVTLLRKVARLHPDREAFIDGDIRLTFAAWDAQADAVAARLSAGGVVQGDIVALVMPSSADYAVCYQAAMRLGAITTG